VPLVWMAHPQHANCIHAPTSAWTHELGGTIDVLRTQPFSGFAFMKLMGRWQQPRRPFATRYVLRIETRSSADGLRTELIDVGTSEPSRAFAVVSSPPAEPCTLGTVDVPIRWWHKACVAHKWRHANSIHAQRARAAVTAQQQQATPAGVPTHETPQVVMPYYGAPNIDLCRRGFRTLIDFRTTSELDFVAYLAMLRALPIGARGGHVDTVCSWCDTGAHERHRHNLYECGAVQPVWRWIHDKFCESPHPLDLSAAMLGTHRDVTQSRQHASDAAGETTPVNARWAVASRMLINAAHQVYSKTVTDRAERPSTQVSQQPTLTRRASGVVVIDTTTRAMQRVTVNPPASVTEQVVTLWCHLWCVAVNVMLSRTRSVSQQRRSAQHRRLNALFSFGAMFVVQQPAEEGEPWTAQWTVPASDVAALICDGQRGSVTAINDPGGIG